MKITPSKTQPNTGVVRMEFEWLMTAAPQTNVMKSRRPRLPAPTKVNRICGNLTTSHRLKVRTLTEGCGRVQVAGGGRIGRCRRWVNNRHDRSPCCAVIRRYRPHWLTNWQVSRGQGPSRP